MTATVSDLDRPAPGRTMTLPSARRLLLWTGIAVLLAWVLVPIYFVALGAFGGRLGVFRWPKSIWPTAVTGSLKKRFASMRSYAAGDTPLRHANQRLAGIEKG